ncbi:MAG: EpsI family protein [Candidatus Solibacter usitatus]|nr:EpsI family protein [Candidatus Solibacter usitatus]
MALLAQGALFYATSRTEAAVHALPLREFPLRAGDWVTAREGYVDEETQSVLRADDTLTRTYAHSDQRRAAQLFVAFFKTQRTGQKPHSPKNCLPGSGWEMTRPGRIQVAVAGEPRPIEINKYLVTHGEERSIVLYWYQTSNRIIASEYSAMYWLIADSIRYNRTDTALVRVVSPVAGNDEDAAVQTGVEFVQAFYPSLRRQLWPE